MHNRDGTRTMRNNGCSEEVEVRNDSHCGGGYANARDMWLGSRAK
jgi:hypothetical protein